MKIQRMFKEINFLKLFQSVFFTVILLLFLNTTSLYAQDSQNLNSGTSLKNQAQLNESREELEKVCEAGKADISDMALLGLTYIQLEEYEMARQILMAAHQQDSTNKQVLEALGRLELAVGNFEAAGKWLKRTGGRASFLEKSCEQKVNTLINHSIELYHDNDFEQAEATLNEALCLAPYHPLILSMLIQLGKEQGKGKDLVEIYQRLVVIDPGNAQVHAELGMLLYEQGSSAEAEKAFLNAEALGTEEPYPYFYLATAGREQQRLEEKELSAVKISRLHSAIGKAVRKISVIQLQAANSIQQQQGELKSEDLKQLEKLTVLFIRPRQILEDSITLLKECYTSSDDYENDLRRLIDWYPHSFEVSGALGSFLEEHHRFEEAYEHWRSILEDFSTAAEAHIGMARNLDALGRLRQAEVAYKRARDLSPENRDIYLALNRLYLSDGQEEALLQWYSELYERERTNITLLDAWADLEETTGLLEEAAIHRLRIRKLKEYD